MPVYDLGYRPYEGSRTGHLGRWWPISRQFRPDPPSATETDATGVGST